MFFGKSQPVSPILRTEILADAWKTAFNKVTAFNLILTFSFIQYFDSLHTREDKGSADDWNKMNTPVLPTWPGVPASWRFPPGLSRQWSVPSQLWAAWWRTGDGGVWPPCLSPAYTTPTAEAWRTKWNWLYEFKPLTLVVDCTAANIMWSWSII